MGWKEAFRFDIVIFAVMGTIPAVVETQGCGGQEHCLRCGPDDVCYKCVHKIMYGTRECVDECPSGYRDEWSSLVDYMGRVCRENTFLENVGLSGRTLAVIVGAVSGAAICLGVLLGAFLYLRHRRLKAMEEPLEPAGSNYSNHSTQTGPLENGVERTEFLKTLATLRPDAPVFLAMLNDTRRKIQKLHPNDGYRTDSKSKAYRSVLRDLSRILTLLNRKEEQIVAVPGDWKKLLSWGERVLRRYKRQNSNNEQPLTYATSETQSTDPVDRMQNGFSSFHPNGTSRHCNRNGFCTGTQYNHNRTDHPEVLKGILKNKNAEQSASNVTILAEWTLDCEAGGEIVPFGRRPQDEITTEL